jgi:glutaredoxin-like protein NrdH
MEFLSHEGIPYTEKNVRQDPRALEELRAMGYSSVPVTVVNGTRIVGFDKAKIEAAVKAIEK